MWLACRQVDCEEDQIWAPWCLLGPDGFPRELTKEEEELGLYGGDRMSVRRAIGSNPKWGGPEAARAYLARHGPDPDLLSTQHDHIGATGAGDSPHAIGPIGNLMKAI